MGKKMQIIKNGTAEEPGKFMSFAMFFKASGIQTVDDRSRVSFFEQKTVNSPINNATVIQHYTFEINKRKDYRD